MFGPGQMALLLARSRLSTHYPLFTTRCSLCEVAKTASHCHLRLDALNVNCNEGGQAPHDASGGAVEFRKCDRWD